MLTREMTHMAYVIRAKARPHNELTTSASSIDEGTFFRNAEVVLRETSDVFRSGHCNRPNVNIIELINVFRLTKSLDIERFKLWVRTANSRIREKYLSGGYIDSDITPNMIAVVSSNNIYLGLLRYKNYRTLIDIVGTF